VSRIKPVHRWWMFIFEMTKTIASRRHRPHRERTSMMFNTWSVSVKICCPWNRREKGFGDSGKLIPPIRLYELTSAIEKRKG
jgi:hypothetical protein